MRIDAHQHFWRYSAGRVRAGSTTRWRRCGATSCRPTRRREMDRAGIDACVAVQARQTLEETRWLLELADSAPVHRRRRRAGSICRRDDVGAQLEQFAAHPKLVGVRHIVQAEPDDRFLLRPAFCRRHRAPRAIRPHLRHPHLSSASAGGDRAWPRVSAAAFRARSPGEAGDPRRGDSRVGGAICDSWPRARTSGASCRGW